MECKSLRDSGKELAKFDIVYFGASCDKPEKNKEFADKLEIEYPLLSDPGGKVASSYGIFNGRFSSRTTFFVGKDGKIAHIQSKVNVRNHGPEIVEQLEKLKIAKKED